MRVGGSDRDRITGPATNRVRGIVGFDHRRGLWLERAASEQRVVGSGRAGIIGVIGLGGRHGQQERRDPDGPPLGRPAAE